MTKFKIFNFFSSFSNSLFLNYLSLLCTTILQLLVFSARFLSSIVANTVFSSSCSVFFAFSFLQKSVLIGVNLCQRDLVAAIGRAKFFRGYYFTSFTSVFSVSSVVKTFLKSVSICVDLWLHRYLS